MQKVMEQLSAGDHAALFYRNRGEQLAAVVPYIRIGLERNERCLYIAEENSPAMIRDALRAGGVDVEAAEKSEALRITTKEATYLRYGVFEPQKMIADLTAEIDRALRDGYQAFRATGEMMWAVSLPSALCRMFEYEIALDQQFPSTFVALCQYNETLFPGDLLSHILRAHPVLVARGKVVKNSAYISCMSDARDTLQQVELETLLTAKT